MDYYNSNKNEIGYREIALKHYESILQIGRSEFCGGYFNFIMSGNSTEKVYITDKREEFEQSVELLALSLFPHFDKPMVVAFNKFLKQKEELSAANKDKDKDKELKLKKLELYKTLFCDLSCLMHRLDYLKAEVYSESDLEDEVNTDKEKEDPEE